MSDPLIQVNRLGPVLEVVLHRPPAHAINRATSRAVHAALRQLQDDPDLRVGLLTATGSKIFSAGWDLKEVAEPGFDPMLDADPELGHGPGGFGGIVEFHDLLKPMICAVNGAAVGGGFEIALACDVILASETSFFQLPEMQRGFLADSGAIQRLPRRLPYNVAVEMLLSGRRMDPSEALRWGLVHSVHPADGLLEAARAFAAEVARGAPLALQACKEVLGAIETMSTADALSMTKPGRSGLPMYERMSNSEDFMEGPRAFAEKREPRWTGR
ncbi:enoyl-CoA hydratase-related protein [Roseibacterium sp. SDUM158016]|uniref:enoyl-CoA hydratase-related protein n=1 Tax=Roseicyclus sediminis TaxID=2980997 RepID=UPI0021D1FB85|nr:enoyl-CoA hydratase-related protein [Roseibacterium sp. SDUM158016]MCU4654713.1 enoyl-CoA hydratase-related protein [Roseibacterium sp. SDUM158016]